MKRRSVLHFHIGFSDQLALPGPAQWCCQRWEGHSVFVAKCLPAYAATCALRPRWGKKIICLGSAAQCVMVVLGEGMCDDCMQIFLCVLSALSALQSSPLIRSELESGLIRFTVSSYLWRRCSYVATAAIIDCELSVAARRSCAGFLCAAD